MPLECSLKHTLNQSLTNLKQTEAHMQIFDIIFCHVVGDYILQQDFIAKTKGSNWYHLFVHCVLYVLPFRVVFGVDWRLAVLFVLHFAVDALKARYKKVDYFTDQIIHYGTAFILYLAFDQLT